VGVLLRIEAALKTPISYNALIIKQYNINRLYHTNNLLFLLSRQNPTIGSQVNAGKWQILKLFTLS